MKQLFIYMPIYNRPDAIKTLLHVNYTTVSREANMSNVRPYPEIYTGISI